jgi:predicted MPP superfamily phosphohydrolase
MACTRRQFIKRVSLGTGTLAAIEGFAIEPDWLDLTHHDCSHIGAGKTIVHLTDIHYRGDKAWLTSLLKTARDQNPDYVCFTGDLVNGKDRSKLAEALSLLGTIGVPLYGVVGNHDPTDAHSLEMFQRTAAATGGTWLLDESVDVGPLVFHGCSGPHGLAVDSTKPRVLLCHYPVVADQPQVQPYDLILSGHSHGGQCRLPGIGALFLPSYVGRYIAGHYEGPAGKIFVCRGLGTTGLPVRFACRPEMAVFRV